MGWSYNEGRLWIPNLGVIADAIPQGYSSYLAPHDDKKSWSISVTGQVNSDIPQRHFEIALQADIFIC